MHATTTAQPELLSSEILLRPDSQNPHTQLIQDAVDACSAQGGGRVVLEAGRYYSGTILLRDGVNLHLQKGAILLGSTKGSDYLHRNGPPGGRLLGAENGTALIYATNASNIALTGEGTLDGNGSLYFTKKQNVPEWVESRKHWGTWVPGFESTLRLPERPRALVLFSECTRVRVELANIQNSPAWTVHMHACNQVELRGIRLRGGLDGSNTDGIDLDGCSDVLVENCDIFTGDDAIALKSTGMWGIKRPCRRIMVRRCRMRSTTHGFTIGTETRDDFEDIVLEDSAIERAGDYRTLTGIGLSMVDGASIRRTRVSNVVVSDCIGPVQIRLANAGRGQAIPSPGSIEDIVLENVRIIRAFGNCLLAGLRNRPLRNITLRNIDLEFSGPVDPSKVMREVPELDHEFPPSEAWRYLPAYGFFCRHLENLTFSGVNITNATGDQRQALWLKNIGSLSFSDFATSDI